MGTRTSPLLALFAAVLLTSGALCAQAPVTRTGPHFVVNLHPGTLPVSVGDAIADGSLAAAESAWPALERLLGAKPGKPVVIDVHADEASFRALAKTAGVSLFRDAFVDTTALQAHVLIWPKLSPQALQLVGLPEPTKYEVLRCAAMLVAAQSSPTAIADPWLAGLVAWGMLEEMTNPTHAFGVDPAYDTRRQPLVRKLEARESLALRSTILDFDVAATREAAEEDDAHQCLLARTMAAANKDWAKKLFAKAPKKGETKAETRMSAVERALGNNWVKTDSLFTKLHQSADPLWQLTAPMAALRDGRWLCCGAPDRSMQFQAVKLPPAGDYAVRGRFEIHPCGDEAFRIQLDWNQKSMIGFFFALGKWRIEKWEVGGDWQELAKGVAPIHRGAAFEAAVEVRKDVRMLVNGQQVATWDPGERTMRGRWSVGVNDCVVWMEKLRIEALGK